MADDWTHLFEDLEGDWSKAIRYIRSIVPEKEGTDNSQAFVPSICKDFPALCDTSKLPTNDSDCDHIDLNVGLLKLRLNLSILKAFWQIEVYEDYVREQGAYDKTDLLERTNQTLDEMLLYAKRDLAGAGLKAFLEPLLLIGPKRQDSDIQQSRATISKILKVRLKPGRKPVPPDESGEQAAIELYDELLEILKPGFDKTDKSTTKYKAVCDAVDTAGIPDGDRQIADQLWERRSPKQVAAYLTAENLQKSESSIKRYLAVQ